MDDDIHAPFFEFFKRIKVAGRSVTELGVLVVGYTPT